MTTTRDMHDDVANLLTRPACDVRAYHNDQ